MRLFDDARDTALNLAMQLKNCPNCGNPIKEFKTSEGKLFPILECQKCHTRIEVSTRHNQNMLWLLMISMTVFALGLALGGL